MVVFQAEADPCGSRLTEDASGTGLVASQYGGKLVWRNGILSGV